MISFSIGEDELRKLSPRDTVGHYSAWNYFQSIDRPENKAFVKAFQARYGKDRVCGLRLFYGVTLCRPEVVPFLPFARKPRRLPAVLSRGEVLQLFE